MKKKVFAVCALFFTLCFAETSRAADIYITESTSNWTNGNNYIANSRVSIPDRVKVSGNVTLTLSDGIEIRSPNTRDPTALTPRQSS